MRRSRIRGEILGIALWWSTRRGGEVSLAWGHFEIVSIGKRAEDSGKISIVVGCLFTL